MSVPPPPVTALAEVSKDERTFAMLAHLCCFVLPVVGPLVLWLVKKDESKFVAYHAIQAAVFQVAGYLISGVLGSVLSGVTLGFCCFASPVFVLLPIVGGVVWAIKAHNGLWEGYPLLAGIGRPEGV